LPGVKDRDQPTHLVEYTVRHVFTEVPWNVANGIPFEQPVAVKAVGIDQQSAHSVLDDFRYGKVIRADDGYAEGHRLENGHAERLDVAWHQENIRFRID